MSPHVSYERRGSGPPLVLVHGLGSRWEAYAPVLDLLASSYDVIAVDLPGFGGSAPDPRFPAGPHGYASWLARFLADLGVEKPHVVGNSMGGGIALEAGRRGIASRVTAFSPIGFWAKPGQWWCQWLLTALRAVGRVAWPALVPASRSSVVRASLLGAVVAHPSHLTRDEVLLQVRGLVDSPSYAAARTSFSGYRLRAGTPWGALPGIPVTVAWGTRDHLLTHRTQSRRARAAMPFAQHVDLPGSGHVPFADDPERCVRVIRGGS